MTRRQGGGLRQLSAVGLAIGAGSAAAEVLEVKSGHCNSLGGKPMWAKTAVGGC